MTKWAVVASLEQQPNALDGLNDDESEVEAHPNDEHTDKDVAESEAAVDTGFNDTEVDHKEAEDVQEPFIENVLIVDYGVFPLSLNADIG